MVTARIRKFHSKTEMDRALDEYITMGYRIREQGENNILVRKHENGNIIVIIVLFCCLVIPAILYVWYKRTHADTILMKIDEADITVEPVQSITPQPVM